MRNTKSILTTLALIALLHAPRPSSAQSPVPNSVAPPLSFCLGKSAHCVMPDFNLSTVNYDLRAKKWDAGVTSIGAGYVLLFYADQPWASGLALHVGGRFGQSGPNYLALTPTLVVCRYFEAGTTVKLVDGGVDYYLTFGLGLAFDLMTGRTIPERLRTQLQRQEVSR